MSELLAVDQTSTKSEIQQILNDVVNAQWADAHRNVVITIPEEGPNQGLIVLYDIPGTQQPITDGIVVETFEPAQSADQVAEALATLEVQKNLETRFCGLSRVEGQPRWVAVMDKVSASLVVTPSSGITGGINQIIQIAANSPIAQYKWKDRGRAPLGYTKGMALVFARTYCKFKANDAAALEMAKANTGNGRKDALAWYQPVFAAAGMNNNVSGADTLRHLFVLLFGLGMRESSGKYFTGRDGSAANYSAETTEAGLFQTSYNARSSSPTLLNKLFDDYSANPAGFLDVFKECPPANAKDLKNWGVGKGVLFQALSKSCPAFAAEFAAVAMRNIGGGPHPNGHWGPIERRETEVRPECDSLFSQIQTLVDTANLCPI